MVDKGYDTSPGISGGRFYECEVSPLTPERHGGSSPRAWGTQCSLLGGLGIEHGSSPRAWGTRAPRGLHPQLNRFIPTCMGNSVYRLSVPAILSVHPHVHGKLMGQMMAQNVANGSSPRAWGTLQPVPEGGSI